MASLKYPVCFLCLVSLICLVKSASSATSASKCLGSPVDLRSSLVGGRATITLPEELMSLKVTVQTRILHRNGAKILRLYPVMVDEKKCITEKNKLVHTCYEFSEIHWGSTNTNGSDHSFSSFKYPMEIQHYFRRTNTTHSLTGLAVGVFVQVNEISPLNKMSPEALSTVAEKILSPQSAQLRDLFHLSSPQTISRKDEMISLRIGSLLPKGLRERRFYQYRGSVSGTCTEARDWIVFEDPIFVLRVFFETLRSASTNDQPNHFETYQEHRCLLHSHHFSDINTCDVISPITEAMNSNNINERLVFLAGARQSSERNGDATLKSAGSEIYQTDLSGSRSTESSPKDISYSPRIAGNRNERSETNDTANVSSTLNPGLKNILDTVNRSTILTERVPATLAPAGQGDVPSPASNSSAVQKNVATSATGIASASPVPANEKNKSVTGVLVVTTPVSAGNSLESRQGNPRTVSKQPDPIEPELVTSKESIQDHRKGNSSTNSTVKPSVRPSVAASVRSLKPGTLIVILSVFIVYF